MSEPVKPATDEQVAALKAGVGSRTWRNLEDVAASLTVDILVARIESDAAKIKALELERNTIQEYADRIGANLTAAEGTIKERDEHIARYEDLIVAQEPETWRNHPGACCCEFCEDRRAIIARRKEADRG